MAKRNVTAYRLSRTLADLDGTKHESKRRWLGKYLRGEEGVDTPTPESVALLERALELRAGYFKLPTKEPRATPAAWRDDLARRLEALEMQEARDVAKLREDLEYARSQIEALEKRLTAVAGRGSGRTARGR